MQMYCRIGRCYFWRGIGGITDEICLCSGEGNGRAGGERARGRELEESGGILALCAMDPRRFSWGRMKEEEGEAGEREKSEKMKDEQRKGKRRDKGKKRRRNRYRRDMTRTRARL